MSSALTEALLPKSTTALETKEKPPTKTPEEEYFFDNDIPIDTSDIPTTPPPAKESEEDQPYTPDGIPNWKQMTVFMLLTAAGTYGTQLISPEFTPDESRQGAYNMAGFILSALVSAVVAKKVVPPIDIGIQRLGAIYDKAMSFCASSKLTTNSTQGSLEDKPPPQSFMKSFSQHFNKSSNITSPSFQMGAMRKSLVPPEDVDEILVDEDFAASNSNTTL